MSIQGSPVVSILPLGWAGPEQNITVESQNEIGELQYLLHYQPCVWGSVSLSPWGSLCRQSIPWQGGLDDSYSRRRRGSAKRSAEHSGRYTLLTDPSGLGENKQIQAKAVALARLSRQGYDLAVSSYEENLSDVPGRIWLLVKLHLKNHKQSWTWRTPGGLRPPNLSPSSLEISRFSFEITGCEFEMRGERGRITAFTFMHNLPFYFPLLSGGYLVNQAPLAGLRILILFVGSR